MLRLASASNGQLLFGLTFLRNYYPGPYRILQHLWSLSVEEQFYLMWPFLFTRLSKQTVSRLLAGVIITAPFFRLGSVIWFQDKYPWHTEQVADALAWGCLLAICQYDLRANRFYQWFSRSYAPLILPFAIIAAANMSHREISAFLGKSIIFVLVALGIDVLIQRHDSVVGSIFNAGPVVWLGKISYSLYLWQQVFFFAEGNRFYARFPLNVGLAFLCAMLSYYLIEQPAIRWGRSVVARRSSVPVKTEACPIAEPVVA
jgi:peptidoglycan/LPS O-acetylase OafA/YrhL